MSVREQLDSITEKRFLILDGAMGSVIQTLHLGEKDFRGERFADHPAPLGGCNDLLCLTKPEAIASIHDDYLQAGADIIETCSFNSTSISLSGYGLGDLAYEISAAAAKIARERADRFSANGSPRFVAGSIGPTPKGASIYADVNDPSKRGICWDELEAAYYGNVRGLLDGGADILLVETVFDTVNAKAALFAVSRLLKERGVDVPVMISAAVSGESGRLLSGQSLDAFCSSLLHVNPWSIGLNCSLNSQKLMPFVRLLSEIAPCLVSAYPNAGLPNRLGQYEETPEMFSANIEGYLKEGLVNIIGSCCGSSPSHTAEIAKKAALYKPRAIPAVSRRTAFSGLETVNAVNNAVQIKSTADDAAKKEFLSLLGGGNYEDAVDEARDIIEDADNGAAFINIEVNDEKTLSGFLDFALMNPYVAKAPFYINSADMKVIETGLKRLQGRCLAGPLSLKDGEAEFLRKAEIIRLYGAAVVVTARQDEARKVYDLLQKNGYPIDNIVIDISNEASNDNSTDPASSFNIDNCPGFILAV
jgi:5-methyltetrahydrofolate--homocysteine methyltransferase